MVATDAKKKKFNKKAHQNIPNEKSQDYSQLYKTAEETKGIMKKLKKTSKTDCQDNARSKQNTEQDSNVKNVGPFESETTVKHGKKKSKLGDFQIADLDSSIAAVETKNKKKNNKKRKQNKSNSAPVENKAIPGAKKAKTLSKDDHVEEISENKVKENFDDLSLGDNAHKLSNLIDDMKVATKKIKAPTNKNKTKKGKGFKNKEIENQLGEEKKEKPKWATKRWNKYKKVAKEDFINTTVLVDNLPLKLILTFRKILTDHFSKYGPIKGFGVAEVYPAVESKPVFTTTLSFNDENAVSEALKNDVVQIEGSKLQLKKILPPEETTIVIKSYSDLSEYRMSSIFGQCGRVRKIHSLVKKGSHMSTAFIEFDGPEAVENALKIAGDETLGKKKMFASKYENREQKKESHQAEKEVSKPGSSNSESDEDSDSD